MRGKCLPLHITISPELSSGGVFLLAYLLLHPQTFFLSFLLSFFHFSLCCGFEELAHTWDCFTEVAALGHQCGCVTLVQNVSGTHAFETKVTQNGLSHLSWGSIKSLIVFSPTRAQCPLSIDSQVYHYQMGTSENISVVEATLHCPKLYLCKLICMWVSRHHKSLLGFIIAQLARKYLTMALNKFI